MAEIKVAGTVNDSIVDGPGLRYVVFVQGCERQCPGCHSEDTHSPGGGTVMDIRLILDDVRKNPLLDGITISGGEPFLQAGPLAELAKEIHELGLTVWTYTGFTFEELTGENSGRRELLEATDVLVDGPYDKSLRSMDIPFRGSANQRIIDVKSSLAGNKIVELDMTNR